MRRSPIRTCSLVALLCFSCGGGGSGGGSGGSLGLSPPTSLGLSVRPEDEPGVEVRTWDAALGALAPMEALLGILGRAAPPELVNQPAYLAQVDRAPLFDGGDPRALARSEGRSSGAPPVRFDGWVIESTQASAGEPQLVRAFGPGQDPALGSHRLFVELRLERDAAAAPPFGVFTLHVAAATDAASLGTPLARTVVVSFPPSGGRGRLQLFHTRGDLLRVPLPGESSEEIALALSARPGGVGGEARVFRRRRADDGAGDTGIVAEETLLAYDATGLLRARNGGAATGFSRLDPVEHVLRYDLVQATGPSAGEPLAAPEGAGWRTDGGSYFWLDQAGLWSPVEPGPSGGAAAGPAAFGEAAEATTYTVVRTPGRFLRLERRTFDLAELDGRALQEWSAGAGGELLLFEVRWNQALGAWQRTGTLDPASGAVTPLVPPTTLAPPANGVRELWADDLGGALVHLTGRGEILGFRGVLEDNLDGLFAGQPEIPLEAWVGAPRSGLTAADLEGGTPFLADAPLGAPHRYVLRRSDLALLHDVVGEGSDLRPIAVTGIPDRGPWRAGFRSGPLLPGGTVPASPGEAWDQPILYAFETGPHPWNRQVTVADAGGDLEAFAPGRTFRYTHTAVADRGGATPLEGATFLLTHGGRGRLAGLPVVPRDTDGDGLVDRHWPAFSLVDGTTLDGSGEVAVRARVIELELRPDPSAAAGLDLLAAGDLVVPSGALWGAPSLGDPPVITEPPRVVDGDFVPPAPPDPPER